MSALLPINLFTMWLATGERGISSEAIVGRLTGVPLNKWSRNTHPHDPADFRRCERLLQQVPLARLALGSMRDVSPIWAAFVDSWDEIVALAERECPGFSTSSAKGSAPLTYARIKELRGALA